MAVTAVTNITLERVSKKRDLKMVRRVEEECTSPTYFGLGTPKQQRNFVENGGTIFFIKEEGKVVGTTSFKPDGKAAYLAQLAIRPQHRHKGYGTKAADLLLEEVKSWGFEKAWGPVHPDNTYSRNIWKNAGFDETDIKPNYFGDGQDRLIVEKRLQ